MGMAASQARYLALVARKTNCEYEGQQINQARTALSNQSANLFNQMLGLQVPVPPSTQEFTKVQYSFTDGLNGSTIDSWQQLATPEEEYNYVVTHHYYTDVYKGSEKKLTDPQVQFAENAATKEQIILAGNAVKEAQKNYNDVLKAYNDAKVELTKLENYSTPNTATANITVAGDGYDVDGDGTADYTNYNNLSEEAKALADVTIASLKSAGAIVNTQDLSKYYFDAAGNFVIKEEMDNLLGTNSEYLVYGSNNTKGIDMVSLKSDLAAAELALDTAEMAYNELEHPIYIGNCELTPIATLDESQEAEIRQIVADMKEQGITSNIVDYYNPETGEYSGGIYSFKMNGVTYYTTYADLEKSYNSGEGINNIDGQEKLAYYNATYVSTKIEKTEKALLETDGNGRFSSIRFQDDSMTYTLSMETITDDAAYQDAMNQYYYESAKYDKIVQDINAKTSIIHQQDQQLELQLKQLETEHNALSNEIDAVQKVVKDNVDKSFKTFGG